MTYIHIATAQYPLYEPDIRAANPQVSFSSNFTPPEGYESVQHAMQPAYSHITHTCTEGAPAEVDGVWTRTWQVTALPTETATANLAAAKLQAWAAIKAERDRRKSGGVQVSGKWYHSDVDSRIQQLGLVMMGASVPSVQWKTMDGNFVTMSQTIANGIFQAAAALDMTLFSVAESHRTAMEASADPVAYDFSAGWPTHYA